MKLIDTNLLIYSQHTEHNFLKHLLFTGVNENAISAITKLEALGYANITFKEKNYLEIACANLQILPITSQIIDKAILLKQSKKMSSGDSVIAATALFYNIPLYTRNTLDFEHIENLVLVNPFNV